MDEKNYKDQIKELIKDIDFVNSEWLINGVKISDEVSKREFLRKELFKHLYSKYRVIIESYTVESLNLKDKTIEQFLANKLSYTESRFWLVDSEMNNNLPKLNGIWIEKDSNKIFIENGQFIKGGELQITENTKITNKSFVYLNTPKKTKFKSTNDESNNYYISISGEKEFFARNKPMIRFYFNLAGLVDGIIEWSNFLSKKLDERGIPYNMKFYENQMNYSYTDSGVLYIEQNHFWIVADILNELNVIFGGKMLRNSVPRFTKKIFNGIGFAEDPYYSVQPLSFGEERCKKIIEFILKEVIKEKLKTNRSNSLEQIYDFFKNDGYNLDEFYRSPKTNYPYDDFKNYDKIPNRKIEKFIPFWGISKNIEFLRVAEKYAKELCVRAIFDGKKYTWITYFEENNKRYHRTVNDDELKHILVFLYTISLFVEDKKYYEVILNKFFMNQEFMRIKTYFTEILTENYSDFFSKYIKNNAEMIEKTVNNIHGSDMKVHDSFAGQNGTYTFNISKDNAEELANNILNNYEKTELPLRNSYGNYQYCPSIQGVSGIGLFFLALYNNRILNIDFKQP